MNNPTVSAKGALHKYPPFINIIQSPGCPPLSLMAPTPRLLIVHARPRLPHVNYTFNGYLAI